MMEKPREPDLIEKIAKGLPLEIRAEFLNEMRYFRSLPESDELLRILRAMMFLTLLTEQVPMRILTEREKLEPILNAVIATANRLEATGSEYHKRLDKRLTQLPLDIANGVNPQAIVELINRNLKKQFSMTTIPSVARELAANAMRIETAASEYTRATAELCDSWLSTSSKAQEAVKEINNAVSKAAKTAERATEAFSHDFRKNYHRVLRTICIIAVLTGIMIGILIFDYLRPRTRTVYEIPEEMERIIQQQQEFERLRRQ